MFPKVALIPKDLIHVLYHYVDGGIPGNLQRLKPINHATRKYISSSHATNLHKTDIYRIAMQQTYIRRKEKD